MNQAFINSIGTTKAPYQFKQKEVANFMKKVLQLDSQQAHQIDVLYRASGIQNRYSVLQDYGKTSNFSFYKKTNSFPSTEDRMQVYQKYAIKMGVDASQNCLKNTKTKFSEITHLITVSCTGMYAPGLDIDLVERLKLPANVQRTCINFMGCYASFNALKLARAFCLSDQNAKVLIVGVELCTLHLQNSIKNEDLLANALFADGASAVLVSNQKQGKVNLALQNFHCDLANEGKKEMTWQIANQGFEMRLSSEVPDIIKPKIKNLYQNLLGKNIQPKSLHYALHPGGKRILKGIEEVLNISKEENRFAHQILQEYGNMSSVTVLFVLERLMQNIKKEENQEKILSFAFGPGLTLESMLLEIVLL